MNKIIKEVEVIVHKKIEKDIITTIIAMIVIIVHMKKNNLIKKSITALVNNKINLDPDRRINFKKKVKNKMVREVEVEAILNINVMIENNIWNKIK